MTAFGVERTVGLSYNLDPVYQLPMTSIDRMIGIGRTSNYPQSSQYSPEEGAGEGTAWSEASLSPSEHSSTSTSTSSSGRGERQLDAAELSDAGELCRDTEPGVEKGLKLTS